MGAKGKFLIEILDDGLQVKITSPGEFSPEIHAKAEEFLKIIEECTGCKFETEMLKPHLHSHGHGHSHSHSHEHGKVDHKHHH